MPHFPRLQRLRSALLVALVAASLAFPLGVLASHQFGDVPNSNIFHDNISAIAGAGVTAGCGGGNFCPSATVTREQMAAFMQRGFGRAAQDSVIVDFAANTPTTVLSTTITPGLVGSGTQFIKADASVSLYVETASGCLCYYLVHLTLDGVPFTNDQYVSVGASKEVVIVSVTGVVAVTSSAEQTIGVVVNEYAGTLTTRAYGNLTAMTAPFGSTGGSTLALDAAAATTGSRPGE